MIIRSIRLRNIKSFAEGPEGKGIILAFDRGLNRLAGPNGAGKSTVIEALGYALFDHHPSSGWRLDLETLLLRSGTKEGEIEAEIETGDGSYFVRRGVGKNNKLRWTVREASGFVTHETEDEVRRFLAAAAGLSAPEALPALFQKLVGVRQGRLLEPFELTAGEARKHFAPILDVEIYQTCFERLRPAAEQLKDGIHARELELKDARARAELLAAAPREAEDLAARVAEGEEALERAKKALAAARAQRAEHDQKERAIPAAHERLAAARRQVEHAEKALASLRDQYGRAELAAKVLERHAAGHAAYRAAQKKLDALAERRAGFEGVRQRVAGLIQHKAAAEERALSGEARARELKGQLDDRQNEEAQRAAALAERRKAFDAQLTGEDAPAKIPAEAGRASALQAGVETWAASLREKAAEALRCGERAREANAALSGFDPDAIRKAQAAYDRARKALEKQRLELTQLEARRASRREMADVLEQSKQCPLLAERCRQFDGGKLVLSEVRLDETLETMRKEVGALEAALAQSEKDHERVKKEIERTDLVRRDVDRALDDLSRHLSSARQEEPRKVFADLAALLAPAGASPRALPAVPELPNPALQPWDALDAAPGVAAAFGVFAQSVGEAARHWKELLEKRRDAAADRLRKRDLEQSRLEDEQARLAEYAEETGKLRAAWEQAAQQAREALDQAAALARSLDEQAARQKDLEDLETQALAAEAERARHEEAHRAHLAAEADARRMDGARAELAVGVGELERARAAAATALTERDAAIAAYDAAQHAAAKTALERAAGDVSALDMQLGNDRTQLAEAQRRVRQLRQAEDAWRKAEVERALLDARRELLEHARRTLREAGPKVAEHLIHSVNARAQRIYTALSPHDPGQLDWRADYELRVAASNGERRFAMLSGGQKVKAALSLQLALVQQFSRAGLCVFDEPTYALDRESRESLAGAIADAQAVSRFEQLFVVSHDDAFDGHVEHTVGLRYSPAKGTAAE